MNQHVQDKAWLILRVAFGLGFAGFHGYGKLFGGKMDGFIETVGGKVGLPFPAFFAWSAALVELAGGLLIALGLFTRPAAALEAMVMVGALVRHRADPLPGGSWPCSTWR
jgi:putative oxidoreductase